MLSLEKHLALFNVWKPLKTMLLVLGGGGTEFRSIFHMEDFASFTVVISRVSNPDKILPCLLKTDSVTAFQHLARMQLDFNSSVMIYSCIDTWLFFSVFQFFAYEKQKQHRHILNKWPEKRFKHEWHNVWAKKRRCALSVNWIFHSSIHQIVLSENGCSQ